MGTDNEGPLMKDIFYYGVGFIKHEDIYSATLLTKWDIFYKLLFIYCKF